RRPSTRPAATSSGESIRACMHRILLHYCRRRLIACFLFSRPLHLLALLL
uniref:Uncharacterized protein n=1 Tax=Aegilops tauschii subsp. strangulata TaxID=200361 RepID=A0A453LJL2_AEGTS